MIILFSLFLLSVLIFYFYKSKQSNKVKHHPKGEYVLKIIINKKLRNDISLILDILRTKMFSMLNVLMTDRDLYCKWKKCGEAKIVLCGCSEDLEIAYKNAIDKNILVDKEVSDDKSLNMILIGPGLKPEINEITNKFKLF